MQLATVLCGVVLVIAACGGAERAESTELDIPSPSTTTPTTTTETIAKQASSESFAPSPPTTVLRAFNGRPVPRTVDNADDAASLFIEVERALRVDGQSVQDYADIGHTEQVLIRSIMRNPEWIEPFRAALPEDLLAVADLHITARTELGLLHTGGGPPLENIPAWEIIEPEPFDLLVGHYRTAGEATGIEWQILAGINLIETGMGRIDGVSTAGAQGPMQFLPTTWDEVSEGGDIESPADAIGGAARYLVQRGGLDDIEKGLWGYNNSDHYVNAVLAYAELVRLDERALRGFYNWEIYVGTEAGTLWLPVGFRTEEPRSAIEFLAENPWARTLQ